MPRSWRAELRRRRTRHRTLVKLRRRFETAETGTEQAAVLVKLSKVAPWLLEDWRRKIEPAPPAVESVARKRTKPAPGDAGRPGRRAPEEVGRPETAPSRQEAGPPRERGADPLTSA